MFKKAIPLLLIVVIAFILRIYQLGDTPKSLHLDEMVNGYVGRYILEHGVDLYGNPYPLFYFNKFGDYPPVLPMYIQAIGIYLFGFNAFGSRIIIAILGTLIVIPAYFITLMIYKERKTALFAALMTAIVPWQFLFSRVSAEGIVALLFYVLGLWLIFKGIIKEKVAFLLYALPFFLLTFITYPSYRIVTPLTLLPLPLFFLRSKKRQMLLAAIGMTVLFFVITGLISRSEWGKGRFDQTSIFNIVSGAEILNTQLIYDEDVSRISPYTARLFHNKLIAFGREFLNQYFAYFDGSFLFMKGGGEIVHKIPNNGQLYLTFLILLALPLFDFFRKRNTNIKMSLLYYVSYLLLIAPIPSALTVIAVPNPHRALPMSIFFIMLIAFGFHKLMNIKFKQIPVQYIVYGMICLEAIYFYHNYFDHVDYAQFLGTNEGAKEAVEYVIKEQDKYKQVIMPAGNYTAIYYLFYKQDLNRDLAGTFKNRLIIDSYKNITFYDTDCPLELLTEKVKKGSIIENEMLVISKENCTEVDKLPLEVQRMTDFKTTFGNPAFIAYKLLPTKK